MGWPSPEDEIYDGHSPPPPGPGLGGEQAVAAVAPVRGPGAGVGADGGGARAPGGPPLPQQLGVKVGMPLGVFTATKKC